jgi:hypothetical protein
MEFNFFFVLCRIIRFEAFKESEDSYFDLLSYDAMKSVGEYQCFGGTNCFNLQSRSHLKMEPICSSRLLVSICLAHAVIILKPSM